MANEVKHAEPPWITAIATYVAFTILFLLGKMRDFFRNLLTPRSVDGYAPIRQDYEDFYTRRLYYRIHDCFNRPIASAPDNHIRVMERTKVSGNTGLRLTGNLHDCVNVGSYNYLGFAADDPYCTPRVQETLAHTGWSASSPRADAGTSAVHVELEQELAAFLGVEAAVTYGMGYATNSSTLPALIGPGCLVLSDALNHASIVAGVRASNAKVRVFKHNNAAHLERVLRAAIAQGQPRTHRPWKKVLIIVEGVYSMEGEICALKEIMAVKKRYGAYLYLDEAHSIGALGAEGKGVCQHVGVDPKDVDVMMGTFTKSFGSCGGYVAGSHAVVAQLRAHSPGHLYACAMSPPAVQQALSALKLIMGHDGTDRGAAKIRHLHDNANYVRQRLLDMKLDVIGDMFTPVMPIMLYAPAKISAFSRYLYELGVAIAVVGFPATPLLTGRARICISAAHTQEDLEYVLDAIHTVSERIMLKYKA